MKLVARVVIAAAVLTFILLIVSIGKTPTPPATTPPATVSDPDWIEKDWHRASATTEVRWINDDAFSHLGGHCYGRKTDGSTVDSNGKPGLAPIAEKFCIAAGAKDTPFDVPDKR